MNVYVDPPRGLSRAMTRVASALKRTSPFAITNVEHSADLVVLHVVGMTNLRELIARIRRD